MPDQTRKNVSAQDSLYLYGMVSDINELGTSFSKENHMLLKTELHLTVLKSCTIFYSLINFLQVSPSVS